MVQPYVAKLAAAGPSSSQISAEDCELLARLRDDVVQFPPRSVIIAQGERPDHVNLVLEGWACRYQTLPDGARQITAFLLPGDFCDAHITLFNAMDHNISALSTCHVARIDRQMMAALLDRPAIARALWWASLVDEAVLRAWIVNLGRRDAFDRIGHLICEVHARLCNVGLAQGDEFELPLTQEDLADALGLTPVHVNRTVRRLREEGLIEMKRGWLKILHVQKLQHVVGFDPNYLHLPRGRGAAGMQRDEGLPST